MKFFSNVLGPSTLVATRNVFLTTRSNHFLMLLSGVCIPLYLLFSLSLLISITHLDCAPDMGCIVGLLVTVVFGGIYGRRFTDTSLSDHLCKSCTTSTGRNGLLRFFLLKMRVWLFPN